MKILIIGLGSIGQRHLNLARRNFPHSRIGVVTTKSKSPDLLQADEVFLNIEDALKFQPTHVVVCNPAPYHLESALHFLSSGVRMLIEKPLSNSSYQVQEFLDEVSNTENFIIVGYNLRHSASLAKYRQIIQSGRIGRIMSVRCVAGLNLTMWRPHSSYKEGVSGQEALGGGALLELSHEIDYISWIFGEIESVYAQTSKQSNLEIDVEDTADLLLGIVSEQGTKFVASITLDLIRPELMRSCLAIGEFGMARWNGKMGSVEIFDLTTETWSQVFSESGVGDQGYIDEWKEFTDASLAMPIQSATALDGLKALKVVDAAKTSNTLKTCIFLSALENKAEGKL